MTIDETVDNALGVTADGAEDAREYLERELFDKLQLDPGAAAWNEKHVNRPLAGRGCQDNTEPGLPALVAAATARPVG